MLLESLMEEKQLNFNRPLLSTRRPSSTQSSDREKETRSRDSAPKMLNPPVYKSDIKSGPVRNPGTVPFQWEHKPGKPKDEGKSDSEPHFVPKLPPGRTLNVTEQDSGRKFESVIAEDRSDCDESEAYIDAVETHSRFESFLLNCSDSGVSGSDCPNLQPCGMFLSDPQTRDFMMERFLPAAKALASETPPHPPPLPKEQPRQIKKVASKTKRQTVHQNLSDFQSRDHWEEMEDESESVIHKSTMPGVCGLLPQICLKSSFGILNPVPSVRLQAQTTVSNYPNSHSNGAQHEQRTTLRYPKTDTREDKTKSNTQPHQSGCGTQEPNGSVSQDVKFHVSTNNPRTKTSKNFGELLAIDDNRWEPSPESRVSEKTLYVDTVHTVKSPLTQAQIQEKAKSPLDFQVKNVHGVCEADEKTLLLSESDEQKSEMRANESPVQYRNHKVNENEMPNNGSIQEGGVYNIPLPECVESNVEKIDVKVHLQKNSTSAGSSNGRQHLLVPPPLPKAPSDSWLKRTLPAIPSKNAFTWTDNFTKIQPFQISPAHAKWETMVKTSNTREGLMKLSMEKLKPIPEA